MSSGIRILSAVVIGFVAGFLGATINGQSAAWSLRAGMVLALTVGFIVAVLSWAIDTAEKKGYGAWLGVLCVLGLNVFGLLLLALLPSRPGENTGEREGER